MKTIFFLTTVCLSSLFGTILGIQVQKNAPSTNNLDVNLIYENKKIEPLGDSSQKIKKEENINKAVISNSKFEKTKISQVGEKIDTVISHVFYQLVRVIE